MVTALDPERGLDEMLTCPDCGGSGYVRVCRCDPDQWRPGGALHDLDCPRVEVCMACLGTGRK